MDAHLYPTRRASRSIESFIALREKTIEGRQRLSVFLFGSVILFIGIPLNFLGLFGPETTFYYWANGLNLLCGVISFLGYLLRKVPLSVALIFSLVATQVEIALEMLYSGLHPSEYHELLIVSNLTLSVVLLMMAEIAYMRYLPVVLSVISLGSYTACLFLVESSALENFYWLFLLVFVVVSLLGGRLIRNVRALEQENLTMKKDQTELLDFLRLNREQVRAYVRMIKREGGMDETEQFLRLIGEESQRKLYAIVEAYLREKRMQSRSLLVCFPELSPSEVEVCRLILQGKRLKEICIVLGKSENNITAHRGHIRKKLRLRPEDNLREVLMGRLEHCDEWRV